MVFRSNSADEARAWLYWAASVSCQYVNIGRQPVQARAER